MGTDPTGRQDRRGGDQGGGDDRRGGDDAPATDTGVIDFDQAMRMRDFAKAARDLLPPGEFTPSTGAQKSVDQDIATPEHDEAVVKLVNLAIDDAFKDMTARGEKVTKEKLLHNALFYFVTRARNADVRWSQNVALRDVDHYFAGRLQEWRKAASGGADMPTYDPETILAGDSAAHEYDRMKATGFAWADPDAGNVQTKIGPFKLEETDLPAGAPGGRFWAQLGGAHSLSRDKPGEVVTDPTTLHISLDDVRQERTTPTLKTIKAYEQRPDPYMQPLRSPLQGPRSLLPSYK